MGDEMANLLESLKSKELAPVQVALDETKKRPT
jgi:hypothetical protein